MERKDGKQQKSALRTHHWHRQGRNAPEKSLLISTAGSQYQQVESKGRPRRESASLFPMLPYLLLEGNESAKIAFKPMAPIPQIRSPLFLNIVAVLLIKQAS